MPLTEEQLQKIREEAEALYPEQKGKHWVRVLRNAKVSTHAAAVVAEREREQDNFSFAVQLLKEIVGTADEVGEDVAAIQHKAKLFLRKIGEK